MKIRLLLLLPFLIAGSTFGLNRLAEIVYDSSLDFPLYKNERYWHGSKATELASFLEGGRRVLRAQRNIISNSAPHENSHVRRVFHAKSNGCVVGQLKLIKDRPQDPQRITFQGLLDPSSKNTYDVLVRFSNGLGIIQSDKLPDVRGAAIKIFGVRNSVSGQEQTVDWLMTNSPRPVGKDFLEFARFMDLVAGYGPNVGAVLFSPHLQASKAFLRTTGLPVIHNFKIKSVATQRYWSGHPYLLGSNMAMKFNIIPHETGEYSKAQLRERFETYANYRDGTNSIDNYLGSELAQRLAYHEIKFTLAVQLEKNDQETPIEDNLVEWKETSSPSIPVAELTLYQRGLITEGCEDLRFTPGHYIPEHRPLSNMGRGRLFGYEASQIGRGAAKEDSTPKILEVFDFYKQHSL